MNKKKQRKIQWSEKYGKLDSLAVNHGFENKDLENLTSNSPFNTKNTKFLKILNKKNPILQLLLMEGNKGRENVTNVRSLCSYECFAFCSQQPFGCKLTFSKRNQN